MSAGPLSTQQECNVSYVPMVYRHYYVSTGLKRVMPPKRKCPANKKAEECTVCCQKVTKRGGKVLFCEGKCQNGYIAIVLVFQLPSSKTCRQPLLRFSVLCVTAVSWGCTQGTESHSDSSNCRGQRTMCGSSTSWSSHAAVMFYSVPDWEKWTLAHYYQEKEAKWEGVQMPKRVKLEPQRVERTSILYMHNPPMYSRQLVSKPWSTPASKSSSLVLVTILDSWA